MPGILTRGRRLLLVAAPLAVLLALVSPAGRLVLALALLLFAPGYLVERALPAPRQPMLVRLAVWLALSMALTALFYQWLWAVSLPLSTPALWAVVLALTCAAAVAVWADLGRRSAPALPEARLAHALTAAAFFAALVTRLLHSEGLALPPWVDSVHHTLMVRIAAETGLAPTSLEPYLPVRDLPYHWGYHVLIATVQRLSALELPETMLLSGQILNALHALTVAALALVLWRRPMAAPVAAVVVGLVSLMPAYYLSWGRYTQLAGLLMLPGLVAVWVRALSRPGRGWWLVAALMLAGLSLVHFRVLVFGLALLAAVSLVWAAAHPWSELKARLLAAGVCAAMAGALTLPWLALLFRRTLLPAVADGGLAGGGSYNALNEGLLWVSPNRLLVALALGAALLGLARRSSATATLMLWIGLLAVAANPWLLTYVLAALGAAMLVLTLSYRRYVLAGVAAAMLAVAALGPPPYLWLITNDVVVISLFMPLAALLGGGAALLYERLARGGPRITRLLAPAWALALALAGGSGAYAMRDQVLNESTVLAHAADRAAIAWAAVATPPEARFLVNAAPWLSRARRGADGGWWLLPLAGRWTTAPPVLYDYGDPAYVTHVNAVADTIIGYTSGREQAILDLIVAERITHIYLVDGVGPLTTKLFAERPGFTQVYAQDGVTIFAVDGAVVAQGATATSPASHQSLKP